MIAPGWKPTKILRNPAYKVTELAVHSYQSGYLVEKDGLKVAWAQVSSGGGNMIDNMIICSEMKFRNLIFAGAVGGLSKDFEIGDFCTPEVNISAVYANQYLQEKLSDFHPFEKIYPNLEFSKSVIELAKDNGYNLKAAKVFCTDSIAMEYSHLDQIKETGAETRVLSSDVKLKTLSGGTSNIIKSDANGIFATVTLSYDKANNKLTFNDGNASQVFELNNFGILQDAFYDSQEKNIVLVVKKDDESTERITIPVGDLVNTWDVENAENSPIVLTKTEGNDGDVLSATVSILNNANNLLVNQNGSLFVDGDCNSHKALWGNEVTDVQGAINLLKERTDDIEEMKEDIEELQEDNENIKIAIASYQTDLENQKDRITTNEENIATLVEKTHEMEVELAVLQERINDFDERITEATDKANEAITTVNNLTQIIGDIDTSKGSISDRLDAIEEVLRQLIDFGEYDIQI